MVIPLNKICVFNGLFTCENLDYKVVDEFTVDIQVKLEEPLLINTPLGFKLLCSDVSFIKQLVWGSNRYYLIVPVNDIIRCMIVEKAVVTPLDEDIYVYDLDVFRVDDVDRLERIKILTRTVKSLINPKSIITLVNKMVLSKNSYRSIIFYEGDPIHILEEYLFELVVKQVEDPVKAKRLIELTVKNIVNPEKILDYIFHM